MRREGRGEYDITWANGSMRAAFEGLSAGGLLRPPPEGCAGLLDQRPGSHADLSFEVRRAATRLPAHAYPGKGNAMPAPPSHRPAIVIVAEDDATRMRIRETLSRRFSNDYRIVEVEASSDVIDEVSRIRDTDAEVALVIAEQQLKVGPGTALLEMDAAPRKMHAGQEADVTVQLSPPIANGPRAIEVYNAPSDRSDRTWPRLGPRGMRLPDGACLRTPRIGASNRCPRRPAALSLRRGRHVAGARVRRRRPDHGSGARDDSRSFGDLRGGPRRWHSDGHAAARHRGMAVAPHRRASRDQCGRGGGPVSSPNGTEISVPADIGRCSIEL
jgi:hypothetical protein